MLAVLEQVQQVARTNLAVLIQGESGTGKELVARALHRASRRAPMPFVTVDSGSLPESLIETELFGYEKGAFTGAEERHLGEFEAANGGTLFLDEVCNLAPATQAKLLHVLDRKEVHHLGGHRPVKVDVRIIAAANKDLEEAVEEGSFRLDLFFRLNEFPIRLPRLRERGGDILLLARHFLEMARREIRKDILGFSEEALGALLSHSWPGNVRELRNAVARAAVVAEEVIEPQHLPFTFTSPPPPPQRRLQSPTTGRPSAESERVVHAQRSALTTLHSEAPLLPLLDLKTITEQAACEAQRSAILMALERSRGNKSRAARLLNVDYKTLLSKIKKLEV